MRIVNDGGWTGGRPCGGQRWRFWTTVGVLAVAAQCSPVIKRDLSSVPAGRVGFDDMCGLQAYFDRLEMKVGAPPTVASSNELVGKGTRSGRSRFTFQTDSQLQVVRQVLTENWRRLPPETMTGSPIEIEVRWSERAGVRRVVTNEDAELTVATSEYSLPYHVCLSELLFGEPLYRQRRVALGLAPLPGSTPAVAPAPVPLVAAAATASVDGGTPDGRPSGHPFVGGDAAAPLSPPH